MSTDRKLLELAAKAAGYTTSHPWNAERLTMNPPVDALCIEDANGLVHTAWNPLDDSGAALNLACDLGLRVFPNSRTMTGQACSAVGDVNGTRLSEVTEFMNIRKDTCRAIVLAAASIGEAKP